MKMRATHAGLLAVILFGCDLNLGDIPLPWSHPEKPTVSGPRVELVALREEPPFVGDEGVSGFGYPLRKPDMAMMASALRQKRFDLLERWMSFYEDEAERDFHNEEWPDVSVSAFYVPDPELAELFDRWVSHSPKHFAPYAARGNYRFAIGHHYRGDRFAQYTSLTQFASMGAFHRAAAEDFSRALQLRPRSIAAKRRLMQVARSVPGLDERVVFDEMIAICPQCFIARMRRMEDLTPRWGGSHEAMAALVRASEAQLQANPRLATLAGYVDWDRACTLREAGRLDDARVAIEQALSKGEDHHFLFEQADQATVRKERAKALPHLDRLLREAPQERRALELRFFARSDAKDYLGAAADMFTSRQVDPTNEHIGKSVEWMVDMLQYQGDLLVSARNPNEAARYFAAGLRIAPDDPELRARMGT